MSSELLTILALVQGGVLVLLFGVLIWNRVARTYWERRGEEGYRALTSAFRRWRAEGRRDAAPIRQALDGCPIRSVRRFLDDVAEELDPGVLDDLREIVRDTRWFDSVRSATGSWLWWRRMDAAQIFRSLGTSEEADLLAELLRDSHGATRLAAMFAARERVLPELLEPLLGRLHREERPRKKVLVDTLLVYGEDLVDPLLARLTETTDPSELKTLLSVLGRLAADHPLPRLRERVLPLTSHRETEVRIEAIRALRPFRDEAAVRSVEAALSDEAWEVRTQAASSLGAMGGGERIREALRSALTDSSWWVRLRAAIALRKLGEFGVHVLESIEPDEDPFAYDMANYVLSLTPRAVQEYAS